MGGLKKQGTRGVIVMEILPAVLILLGFMITGYRLLWLSHELDRASEALWLKRSAFEYIWSHWLAHGGRAATARVGEDGIWEIHDFPDETWLPLGGNTNRTLSWRRRFVEAGPESSY